MIDPQSVVDIERRMTTIQQLHTANQVATVKVQLVNIDNELALMWIVICVLGIVYVVDRANIRKGINNE